MEAEKSNHQVDPGQEETKPQKKQRGLRIFIREVIIGDFLSREIFFNNIPFLGYLTIIALIYISNTYYAEKTFRQIERTKSELKEIRFQYVAAKSTLMFYSKLSEVSKRVIPLGLMENPKPPYKIFYNRDSLSEKSTTGKIK